MPARWRPRGLVGRDVLVAAAVGAIAIAVRLPAVYAVPFWEDEVASARILREPTLPAMLHRITRTESTPPLWYLLGWLLHHLGLPLRDVRLLSVVLGGILAVLVLALARRFVALPLAAAAGLMVALGAEFVRHGYELRAYELLAVLCIALALALFAELARPSRRADVALAATVAAGGLTHVFFAFSALAALAWVWLDPCARAIRRRACAAIVVGGAVAATWSPALLAQYRNDRFWWIGPFRLRYVASVPLRLFTHAWAHTTVGLVVSSAALLVLGVGCVRVARRSAQGRAVVVLALGPLLSAAALWAGGVRIFDVRNLVGIGGFVAVAAVAAVDALPRRAAVGAALAATALLAWSLAVAHGGIPRYDLEARALVRDGWNGSQPIAVYGDPFLAKAPLEWYLPRQPFLALARPDDAVCSRVFVVEPAGAVVALRLRAPAASARALRRVTFLVEPSHTPRCAHVFTPRHIPTVA